MSTAPEQRTEVSRPRETSGRPLAIAAGRAATPPSEAELTEWVRAGAYGTDGRRTWRWDDTKGCWVLLVSAHVRFLAERTAAPDPDFPERDEDGEDDSLEAGADVSVTVERAGSIRSKTYRNIKTSNLRKLTMLDRFGPSAWHGASATTDGRAHLFRAFNDLSAMYGMDSREFYAVTGWHPAGPGEVFVHGGGVIDARGQVEGAEVRIGDQLSLLTLGNPAHGAELVEAMAATVELVDAGAMPGRVLFPLLAGALRPLFGMYRDPRDQTTATEAGAALWVSGNTGGGKSGSVAAALNPVYPGIAYNRFPFKAGGARNGGASGPGLERLGFKARDLVLPFDDLDPSERDSDRAAWQSDLLRRAFGQYGRVLATAKGQANRAAMPWRAGVIGTGEPLDAEASAENRALNVPIGPGDVRVGVLREHTGSDVRAIRGRIGAGLVRVLAGDRAAYRARMAAARTGLRPLFVADGRDVPGPVARGADTMAEVAATLRVLLSVLVDEGMSTADARRYWRAIVPALQDAWRAHLTVIGGGDRASRAIGYLSQAMSSGAVRLDDLADPSQPSRDLIGWRMRTGGGQFASPEPVPMSQTVGGYQDRNSGDLYLMPAVATGAVKAIAERAGDSWTGSTKTITEALKAGGYLRITQRVERDSEGTERKRIPGRTDRPHLWHLLADRFNDGPDGNEYAGTDWSGPINPDGLPCSALDVDQADAAEPVAPVVAEREPAEVISYGPQGDPEPCEQCGVPTPNRINGRPRHLPTVESCEVPRPAAQQAVTAPARATRAVATSNRQRPTQAVPEAFPDAPADVDPAELARAVKVIREHSRPDASEAECEAAYALFRQATGGVRLIGDPGFVGAQWFRWWRDRNSGSVKTEAMRSELVEGISTGGDLFRYADHVRADAAAVEGDSLVALDVNAAYLAAMTTVELGHGEPSHYQTARDIRQITGQARWTKRPGYALLTAAPELVAPVAGLDQLDAGTWLPLPWADFLVNPWAGGQLLAKPLAVGELVYWHQGDHGKRLARWAGHVWEAETTLKATPGQAAHDAARMVKAIRNAFSGGYLRSERYNPTETLRFDWYDMNVSQHGANLARKVIRPAIEGRGPAPVGVFRDDVYYLADEPPEALAPVISAGLGKLKVKGIIAASPALVDAIEARSAYEISRAVAASLREV